MLKYLGSGSVLFSTFSLVILTGVRNPMWISGSNHFPELKILTSHCLFDISMWMCTRCLKLHTSKIKPPDLPPPFKVSAPPIAHNLSCCRVSPALPSSRDLCFQPCSAQPSLSLTRSQDRFSTSSFRWYQLSAISYLL